MTEGVTSITLNEADRKLSWLAAWICAALEPGETRTGALEELAQAYRDDVGEAHPDTASAVLDEMTDGFTGALMLGIENLQQDRAGAALPDGRIASPRSRPRVLEAIGRYMEMVKPTLTH